MNECDVLLPSERSTERPIPGLDSEPPERPECQEPRGRLNSDARLGCLRMDRS